VSPYVTECPYCGTRLRKRAPKLERVGDEVRVREGRGDKRRRKAAERRERLAQRAAFEDLALRPMATIVALAIPAIALIVERASNLSAYDLGAIVGPVGDEWWRYFAAPFVYDNVGYLFACGIAIALFLPGIERRVGSVAAGLLVLGCGALGMLAADGLDATFADGIPLGGVRPDGGGRRGRGALAPAAGGRARVGLGGARGRARRRRVRAGRGPGTPLTP
jgi:hypothetical protein